MALCIAYPVKAFKCMSEFLDNKTLAEDSVFMDKAMRNDPVFKLGVAGGVILLVILFLICAYALLMSACCEVNEMEQSWLSEESIERHRRLFEAQEQSELRHRPRSNSSVALDTLEEIQFENRHQPLNIQETIKLLHARLKEKGTLPNHEETMIKVN